MSCAGKTSGISIHQGLERINATIRKHDAWLRLMMDVDQRNRVEDGSDGTRVKLWLTATPEKIRQPIIRGCVSGQRGPKAAQRVVAQTRRGCQRRLKSRRHSVNSRSNNCPKACVFFFFSLFTKHPGRLLWHKRLKRRWRSGSFALPGAELVLVGMYRGSLIWTLVLNHEILRRSTSGIQVGNVVLRAGYRH